MNRKDLKYIDVAKHNVDGTHTTSDVTKIGNVNPYLGMELCLNKVYEGGLHFARVKKRAVDDYGKPIVQISNNPVLDSRKYEVEYVDGNTAIMAANVMAENLMAQVDEHGNRNLMIDEIEYHITNK